MKDELEALDAHEARHVVTGQMAVREYGRLMVRDQTALYNLPKNHKLWGSTTTLVPAGSGALSGPFTVAILTETFDEAVDWHIEVQLPVVPTGPGGAGHGSGVVTLQLQAQIGQQTMPAMYFSPQTTATRRIHVYSRFVQLAAAWWGVGGLSSPPASLQLLASCGVGGAPDSANSMTIPEWSNQWSSAIGSPVLYATQLGWSAANTTALYSPFPVGGTLQAFQASVITMTGDTQVYVQFIDKATAPIGGEVPIWTSPPLTAANQWIQFDDGDMPEVKWSTSLWGVLSSTPGGYTASTGSGSVFCPIKVGR